MSFSAMQKTVAGIVLGFIGGAATILASKIDDKIMYLSIFAIVVIVGAAIYFVMLRYIDNVSKGRISPSKHIIFSILDGYLDKELKSLPIEDEYKKAVSMKYLKIRYTNIKDALKLTVCDRNVMELPTRITNAITKTEDEAFLAGVPKIFINKISGYYSHSDDNLIECMVNAVRCTYYKTDDMRLTSCLDMALVMIRNSKPATEQTLNSLNGELSEYRAKNPAALDT